MDQPSTDPVTPESSPADESSVAAPAPYIPPAKPLPIFPPPPPPVLPSGVTPPSQAPKLWEIQSGGKEYLQVSLRIRRKSENTRRAPARLPVRFFGTRLQAKVQPVDYVIEEIIGQGGMGVVYRARQSSLNRHVAVKALKPEEAADEGARQLFLAEAIVTGDLDHPNIVPVHELGTNVDGQLFYTMKQVQGTAWRDALPEKSVEENLDILLRVADAVAFAHSRGLLHCDLKPDNVMLGSYGEVFVMDWGLAVSMRDLEYALSTGEEAEVGGTPVYLPPEFARRELDKVGVASDVYLLGGILYEILTGRPPHFAESISQVITEASINAIRPISGHPEFAEIAMKALATEPWNRYATVKDFQADLRNCRRHMESVLLAEAAWTSYTQAEANGHYTDYSRAVHGYEQALKLWDGNHAAKEGRAFACLGYARCALARDDLDLAESLLEEDNPEQEAVRREIRARRQERKDRQASIRRLKRGSLALMLFTLIVLLVAYWRIRDQRAQAEYEGFVNGTRLAVDRLMSGDWDEVQAIGAGLKQEKNGWEWTWLERNSQLRTLPMSAPGATVLQSRLSSFGGMTAFLRSDGHIEIHQEARVENNGLPGIPAGYGAVQLEPQSKTWNWNAGPDIQDFRLIDGPAQDPTVITWNGHEVASWNAYTGQHLSATVLSSDTAVPGILSPNASYVLLMPAQGDPAIYAADKAGAPLAVLPLPQGARAMTGAFSPMGKQVALILSAQHQFAVFDWTDPASVTFKYGPNYEGKERLLTRIEYLPDGKGILLSSFDRAVVVLDPYTLTPRLALAFPQVPSAFAASADSRLLAAGTTAGELQVQELSTGNVIWHTRLHDVDIASIVFQRDGEGLVIADDKGRLIDVSLEESRPWRTLRSGLFPALNLAFNPAGHSLLISDQDNKAWEVPLSRKQKDAVTSPLGIHVLPRAGLATVRDGANTYLVESTMEGLAAVDLLTKVSKVWIPDFRAMALAASADGRLVAASQKNEVRVYVPLGHDPVASWKLPTDVVVQLAWLPGTHLLAAGCADGTTYLLDSATQKILQQFKQGDAISAIAASPDGKEIVTASKDRTVDVWDVATGRLVQSLQGHAHSVLSMAFAPDQTRLYTASADGLVHVFDLKTWRQIMAFPAHRGAAVQVVVSPDGSTLVTSGTDGEVRLWPGMQTSPDWL